MTDQAPIRGVSIDAAGTLLFPHPGVGQAYCEVAAQFGMVADPESVEAAFRRAFRDAMASRGERDSEAESRAFWHQVVEQTFPSGGGLPLDHVFRSLWDRFARGSAWRTAAAARTTLERLRERGFRLAVASNNDARLRRVLGDLGLLNLFDFVAISSEIGWRKPSGRFFAAVAEGLHLNPEEILHFGDHPEADVAGARRAGFRALRFDPSPPDDPATTDWAGLRNLGTGTAETPAPTE